MRMFLSLLVLLVGLSDPSVAIAKVGIAKVAIAKNPGEVAERASQKTFAALRERLIHVPPKRARQLVAEFLKDHPTHREAAITLGRLHILNNQPQMALHVLDPLVSSVGAKNHSDWQAWFWAGTAYLAIGDTEAAREMLDVAVAKEGKAVEVWVQLAVLEQELGNHATALQYIAIAEQNDANAAEVYLNRAYSLEHLGEFDAALRAYRQFMVSEMSANVEALRPSVMRRMTLLSDKREGHAQASDQRK